jgi:uncharacterized metal-binding protein YceD (DUF177 family)
VPLDRLKARAEPFALSAGPAARAALARRFGLLDLPLLSATLEVRRSAGGAEAQGWMEAEAVQACVLSGEPVVTRIDEPLHLRFETLGEAHADEVELSADDLDIMGVEDGMIDLGEALAQSLALALPPYPRAAGGHAPGVTTEEEDAARRAAASPFAVLKRP